jgi:hypothetical protein
LNLFFTYCQVTLLTIIPNGHQIVTDFFWQLHFHFAIEFFKKMGKTLGAMGADTQTTNHIHYSRFMKPFSNEAD